MRKAAEYIRASEANKLYKKVNGRFVQANDYDCTTGLREGWWLVKVEPGSTSMKCCLFPDRAEVQAAMIEAEDKIVEILRKATEAKPKVKEITPEFKKAWEKMVKKFGSEMNYLEYNSLQGVAETIMKEVMKGRK